MAKRLLAKIDGFGKEYRVYRDDRVQYNHYGVYERMWNRATCSWSTHLLERYSTYTDSLFAVARHVMNDR